MVDEVQFGEVSLTGRNRVLPTYSFGASAPVTIKAMSEEMSSSKTFEAGLEELERIVKDLEKGDLPLEQSLRLFESGVRLSSDCKRQLEEAESRVEILMRRGSDYVPVPFEPDKPAK